nr:hypothetical protein [uncultured Agathobaculum sp.]
MDKKLLDALAARAEQRAQARTETKPFEIGGQMIVCKKLTPTQQLEYYGSLAEAGGAADMIGICTSLIYDSCPTLQDPELHKTLGVVDPYDAVRQLMSVREIDRLGGELIQWNGLMPGKPDGGQTAEDTAKNS